jgi:hypothetical protein
MPTSEIEKLERRYAENPQGLTFAPLAEVHRKGGDVARALELLHAGLELHPNYIPASIVLGRCHWDLGDLPAAEAAFAHVLRLDDENVIALKSLADINERLERLGEAQRWLHRLVSVDRSNEEARQQLSRLEKVKEQGDRKPESKPVVGGTSDLRHEVAAVETAPASEPKPTIPPAVPAQPARSDAPALELTVDLAQPEAPAKPAPPAREIVEAKSSTLEFLDMSEPARAAESGKPAPPAPPEEPVPVDGLISQEFVPPKQASYPLHPELTQDFVSGRDLPERIDVETTEDVELKSSGAAEFRVPNAAEDFLDLAARMNAAREDTPTLASHPPIEEPLTPPTARAERPATAGLKLVTDSDAGPGKQSYSARDTKGQSVADFFKGLLAARPAGNPGPGTPTNSAPVGGGTSSAPAPDAFSLSSVLGEGSVTNPPTASTPGQAKEPVVSFDDFFGSSAGGASPQPHGSGDPGNDDLDQFQSWLQNLKR